MNVLKAISRSLNAIVVFLAAVFLLGLKLDLFGQVSSPHLSPLGELFDLMFVSGSILGLIIPISFFGLMVIWEKIEGPFMELMYLAIALLDIIILLSFVISMLVYFIS